MDLLWASPPSPLLRSICHRGRRYSLLAQLTPRAMFALRLMAGIIMDSWDSVPDKTCHSDCHLVECILIRVIIAAVQPNMIAKFGSIDKLPWLLFVQCIVLPCQCPCTATIYLQGMEYRTHTSNRKCNVVIFHSSTQHKLIQRTRKKKG